MSRAAISAPQEFFHEQHRADHRQPASGKQAGHRCSSCARSRCRGSLVCGCADVRVKDTSRTFRTVVIDAGHGGHDSGRAFALGRAWKKMPRSTSRCGSSRKLRAAGFHTVMTRRGDHFHPARPAARASPTARTTRSSSASTTTHAAQTLSARARKLLPLAASRQIAANILRRHRRAARRGFARREDGKFPGAAPERISGGARRGRLPQQSLRRCTLRHDPPSRTPRGRHRRRDHRAAAWTHRRGGRGAGEQLAGRPTAGCSDRRAGFRTGLLQCPQGFQRGLNEFFAGAGRAAGADDFIVALRIGLAIRNVADAAVGEFRDEGVLEGRRGFDARVRARRRFRRVAKRSRSRR